MGDGRRRPLQVDFDRRIRLEFHGAKVTSDTRLLPYRELDEALAPIGQAKGCGLSDSRTCSNAPHMLPALLRQSISSRLVGYEDNNDAK